MKVIALILVVAIAAVNAGYYTANTQVHDVALHAPIYHAPAPLLAPTAVLHTSSSSSYKVRAPAAKIAVATAPIVHASPFVAPSIPIVHTMSHGVLLH